MIYNTDLTDGQMLWDFNNIRPEGGMMYAIVKTIEEANQLNEYIKAGYYNEVPGASFEKWTEIVPVAGGFTVEILDFMQYRRVLTSWSME